MALTNALNLSPGSDAAGAAVRTCCLFVQGDDQGYPISVAPGAPPGVAVIDREFQPGERLGVLLRVPNYKSVGPLAAITFSRSQGDKGMQFPTRIKELP